MRYRLGGGFVGGHSQFRAVHAGATQGDIYARKPLCHPVGGLLTTQQLAHHAVDDLSVGDPAAGPR